jgi:hypothetical protein
VLYRKFKVVNPTKICYPNLSIIKLGLISYDLEQFLVATVSHLSDSCQKKNEWKKGRMLSVPSLLYLLLLQELEQMKEVAKQRQLPPVYMGKWATASDSEVQQELEKGTPYTYRFRVPKEGSLKINDLIRGEVMSESSGPMLQ